jgi:polar amino acid transport system substrate-binding protein
MKKLIAATLLLLLNTGSHADTEKTITYGDHASYPPLSWLHGQQLKGVTHDAITQIFKEQGYELLIYVYDSWKRCMLEVELGNIDAAVAYRTPERDKKLAFTDEYLIAEKMAIFVNKDHSFKFQQWQDLADKHVGMVLGYSYGAKFDAFLKGNTNIERVSSNFQNITKLALNRIDFMPFELNSGLLQVRTHGYQDVIIPLETIATTDYLYLATAKHNKKIIPLLPKLNASLKKLKQQGFIDKLVVKHQQNYLKLYPEKPVTDQ